MSMWPDQYGEYYCETCDWFHGLDEKCNPDNEMFTVTLTETERLTLLRHIWDSQHYELNEKLEKKLGHL